jgi:hypothetical protein
MAPVEDISRVPCGPEDLNVDIALAWCRNVSTFFFLFSSFVLVISSDIFIGKFGRRTRLKRCAGMVVRKFFHLFCFWYYF